MKTLNFWRSLFFSALAVTAFTACGDDDETKNGSNFEPSITVDGQTQTSVAHDLSAGQTAAVKVVSAGEWTIARDVATDTWCTPSVMKGNGGTTDLIFEVAAATADRQATFTLTAMGKIMGVPYPKTAKITVRQNTGGSTVVETNVAAIRTKMKAIATDTAAEITEDLTLTGIVVSDIAGGGFAGNKNCAVVDNTTDAGAGILVRFSPDYKFALGQVITGSIKGAKVKLNYGVLQIEANASNFSAVVGSVVTVAPIESTIADLTKYESQYVKVNNVQPVTAARGKTFVDPASENYTTTTFENVTGTTFGISIYKTNDWAKTSTVPSKSGFVCGLVGLNNGAAQVAPRNAADVAGLTNELFQIDTPDPIKKTISEITEPGVYEVDAVVAATYESGFVIEDATGVMLVYQFVKDAVYVVPAVGKIVTIEGTVEKRNGVLQFSPAGLTVAENGTGSPAVVEPVVLDGAAADALYAAPVYKYVKYTGKLIVSGTYYNVQIDGATVQGSLPFPNASLDVASFKDKIVDIEGWFIGTAVSGSNKFMNTMVTKISANTTIPNITITTVAEEFTNAGNTQTFDFTKVNVGAGNKVYAKIEGADAAQFSVPAGEITGASVTVTAIANATPAKKLAKLVIYAAATEGGAVALSDEVDLVQEAKLADGAKTVTFDFSTLTTIGTAAAPVTIDGISLITAQNKGATTPAANASAGEWRLYSANSLTVKGATITNIEFTFTSATYTNISSVLPGTLTDAIWIGSANSVEFTSNPNKVDNKTVQTRIKKVVVTYTE